MDAEKVTGTVTRWFEDRGFGFATVDADGADAFVHARALRPGVQVTTGSRVRFAVLETDRGPRAQDVELLMEGGR
jgi:CspA family cold shock protein